MLAIETDRSLIGRSIDNAARAVRSDYRCAARPRCSVQCKEAHRT